MGVWPKSGPESLPHAIFNHKATKSWFCILNVVDLSDNKLHWLQFRMDKKKSKIVWQRLVAVPEHASANGDWLYFDEVRDVLIGFECTKGKEYVFKYLPDMTKYLWIDSEKENDPRPVMQRSVKMRKKTKEKITETKRISRGGINESNIRPSKASKKPKMKKSKVKKKALSPTPIQTSIENVNDEKHVSDEDVVQNKEEEDVMD